MVCRDNVVRLIDHVRQVAQEAGEACYVLGSAYSSTSVEIREFVADFRGIRAAMERLGVDHPHKLLEAIPDHD